MKKFTIDLFVNNRFGVWNRITGLYQDRNRFHRRRVYADAGYFSAGKALRRKKGRAEVCNGFGLSC